LKDSPAFPPADSLNRFVVATAGAAIALWALWFGLSNPLTETADRVYFLSTLAVGGLALWIKFPARTNTVVTALGLAGLVVLVWGLRAVEHLKYLNEIWLGFRLRVAIASILLLPVIGFLLRRDLVASRLGRLLAGAVLVSVACVGALSFVQTRDSLGQKLEASYFFNELYSVSAGHHPYTDFIPQYQTLYSYLFYPLIQLLGADRALNPMLYVLSALGIGTIALGVTAGLRATRGLSWVAAPLLILPLVFLTQGPGRTQWAGSIAVLHSAFPVRMLLPTLIGVIITFMPLPGSERWQLRKHGLALGALSGLSCYHQLDFGLAAAFALGAVVLVAAPLRAALRVGAWLLLGAAGGFLTVPVLQGLSGVPVQLNKLGWFLRQFGSGFGAEPMQIPGPVLVVLPLLVGATITCVATLKALRANPDEAAPVDDSAPAISETRSSRFQLCHAALVGSYFGVFAIAAFPYYLNRSFASGQLQITLMPLGIVLAATARVVIGCTDWTEEFRSARSLVFRLALAIPVASLLLMPSPAHELARLSNESVNTAWPHGKTTSIVALGEAWKKLGSSDAVGYWGSDGNYIESMTGLRNLTRFNSPTDGDMSAAALNELCSGIASPNIRALVLGERAINPSVCQSKWRLGKSKTGIHLALRQ
jgi:hypothetical protein